MKQQRGGSGPDSSAVFQAKDSVQAMFVLFFLQVLWVCARGHRRAFLPRRRVQQQENVSIFCMPIPPMCSTAVVSIVRALPVPRRACTCTWCGAPLRLRATRRRSPSSSTRACAACPTGARCCTCRVWITSARCACSHPWPPAPRRLPGAQQLQGSLGPWGGRASWHVGGADSVVLPGRLPQGPAAPPCRSACPSRASLHACVCCAPQVFRRDPQAGRHGPAQLPALHPPGDPPAACAAAPQRRSAARAQVWRWRGGLRVTCG